MGEYDLRVRDRSERQFGVREKLDVPEYGANGTKVGDLAVLLLDLSNQPAISFSAEVRYTRGVQKVRGLTMKEMVAVFWDADGCAARQFPGAWVHH